MCVRPNRYALALAIREALGAETLALHERDIPPCVKVARLRAAARSATT
jgi:hypothetical protein